MTSVESLDPDVCYRAAVGRDPRWDGRVYIAVVTTGVYCRPSCPARKPYRHNCRFFASAAAAVAAGFRACKRCRPDAIPGSRQWDTRGDLVARAVRMIRDGVVDEVGVSGLATRLATSERHLHRQLVAEVGASANQLNRTRRAQAARLLIEQTSLPLVDVAFASGFGSVRQFNAVIREEFGSTPSALRRPRNNAGVSEEAAGTASGAGPVVVLRLRYRVPIAMVPLRRFLAANSVAGLDRHDAATGKHSRTVPAVHGPAMVTVLLASASDHIVTRVQLADIADLMPVVGRVRRWLDLDADPQLIDETLGMDPLLAPMVGQFPGLRVPGSVDGAEIAVRAVLGRKMSKEKSHAVVGRLVSAYGGPAPGGFTAFPRMDVLAEAGPDALGAVCGIGAARARSLHALACALADGLVLDPGADRQAARRELLALSGIDTTTADHVALHALGNPDAFPAGESVLKRVLGTTWRAASAYAEHWRPWRGYALLHLSAREAARHWTTG